jgi:methionine salvage enolase-phosphatase E1
MKTSKKDFEVVKKILLKVKKLYLDQKAEDHPEVPVEQLAITDDDQVPLELLTDVQAQEFHKHETKIKLFTDMMKRIQNEQLKQVRAYDIKQGKIKATLEDSVFSLTMNTMLEERHEGVFKKYYMHE